MYDKDKHIEQLELTIEALTSRVVKMKKERVSKNDAQSLKWRNSSFYWKNKCRFLEEYLKVIGVNVPTYEN
jgi:hypothetical protein